VFLTPTEPDTHTPSCPNQSSSNFSPDTTHAHESPPFLLQTLGVQPDCPFTWPYNRPNFRSHAWQAPVTSPRNHYCASALFTVYKPSHQTSLQPLLHNAMHGHPLGWPNTTCR
jgi:hypothetical protein